MSGWKFENFGQQLYNQRKCSPKWRVRDWKRSQRQKSKPKHCHTHTQCNSDTKGEEARDFICGDCVCNILASIKQELWRVKNYSQMWMKCFWCWQTKQRWIEGNGDGGCATFYCHGHHCHGDIKLFFIIASAHVRNFGRCGKKRHTNKFVHIYQHQKQYSFHQRTELHSRNHLYNCVAEQSEKAVSTTGRDRHSSRCSPL